MDSRLSVSGATESRVLSRTKGVDVVRRKMLSHCMLHRDENGTAQRGAAITEFIVVLPMLLLIALGCIQWAYIYQAKVTVDHAAFMAARAGAVSGADIGTMRRNFAKGILPLYSPDKDAPLGLDVDAGLTAFKDAQHWGSVNVGGGATQMLIINPTREAFEDYGMDLGSDRVIPNDRLHLKSQAIVGSSNVSIQDANLLKVHVLYGYPMKLPFISDVLTWIGIRTSSNIAKQAMWRAGRIPILATSTVRMQSNAKLSDNVLAMGEIDELLESDSLPIVNGLSYDGHRPWDMGPSGGSSDIPDITDFLDLGSDFSGDPGDFLDPGDPGDSGGDPGPGSGDPTVCAPNDISCLTTDPGNGSASCAIPGGPGDDGGLFPGITPIPSVGVFSDRAVGSNPGALSASNVTASSLTTQSMSQPSLMVGNPINIANGNKYQQETDIQPLVGMPGLEFVRHYNSRSTYAGSLGHNWRHTYDLRVRRVEGSEPQRLRLYQADGRTIDFTLTQSSPDASVTNQLVYAPKMPHDGMLIDRGKQGFDWVRQSEGASKIRLEFNHKGWLDRIVPGNDSRVVQLHYDAHGEQLLAVSDAQQRRLNIAYYNNGRIKRVTNPAGSVTTYRYDAVGNLVNTRYLDGTSRTYHYDDSHDKHNLTGITNGRGIQYASYAYDQSDRAVMSAHAGGAEKVTVEYGASSSVVNDDPALSVSAREVKVTNSLGEVTTYVTELHNGLPLVKQIRGPGCDSCGMGDVRFEYNQNFQVAAIHKAKGASVQYAYDDRGRLLSESVVAGDTQRLDVRVKYSYENNATGQKYVAQWPSVKSKGWRSVEKQFNRQGRLIEVSESGFAPKLATNSDLNLRSNIVYLPINRTSTIEYNSAGLPIRFDGPRSDVEDVVTYQYDSQHRLKSIRQADGRSLFINSYNALGNPTQLQAGALAPVDITYNFRGQATQYRYKDQIVQYQYDADGKLSSSAGPDYSRVDIERDTANRVASIKHRSGVESSFKYDSESRLSEHRISSPFAGIIKNTNYLYDQADRLVEKQEQLGEKGASVRTWQFDANGQSTATVTRADGVSQRHTQGAQGDQSGGATPAERQILQAQHRATKGVDTIVDARGVKTQILRDDFDRIVVVSNPSRGRYEYTYDSADNLVGQIDNAGNSVRLVFDASNRVTRKETVDARSGETNETLFKYENSSGKLVFTQRDEIKEYFKYDQDGLLSEHTRDYDAVSLSTHYQYDNLQRLSVKQLPDGQQLRYHYHADGHPNAGKLRAITRLNWLHRQETIVGELNAAPGLQERVTFHNGLTSVTTYNAAGEVVAIEHGDALKLNYTYDKAGHIKGIDLNDQALRYRYDPSGRLIFANHADRQFSYRYDTSGNRIERQIVGQQPEATVYSIERSSNRLLGSVTFNTGEEVGVTRLNYDAIGNTESSRTQQPTASHQSQQIRYVYNVDGKPTQAYVDDELVAEYAYNSWGMRVKKTLWSNGTRGESQEVYYLYDGNQLSAEVDSLGAITAQYIYVNNKPVAQLKNKQIYAVHTDHLGTPRSVTNDKQAIVWQASYSPFGKADIVAKAKHELNLRFPGQYFDQETQNHYNYHRIYNPDTGRYLSADPIGLGGGLNAYAYVNSNPISGFDPLGLFDANDSLDAAQIQALQDGGEAAVRAFVEAELQTFEDRQNFYNWIHSYLPTVPSATQSNWFLAAAQVNGSDALGGVDNPASFVLFSGSTRDYLRHAGLELAIVNTQTFLQMLTGDSPLQACYASTADQDAALVAYEQGHLEQITSDYFANRPDGEEDTANQEINDLFNGNGFFPSIANWFSNDTISLIIEEEFTNNGIDFDISNIEHRIILGQRMVQINAGGG